MSPLHRCANLFALVVFTISGCSPLPPQTSHGPAVAPHGYQVLYRFRGSDGSYPGAALTSFNGVLYGTTIFGGEPKCYIGCGTVFSFANGKAAVLYRFPAGSGGAYPQAGLAVLNGTLYGTTTYTNDTCPMKGGFSLLKLSKCGTFFSITPNGAQKVLYAFNSSKGSIGSSPEDLLLVGNTFYGTTLLGGVGGCGAFSSSGQTPISYGCGVAFSFSSTGAFHALHVFQSTSTRDGAQPSGPLVQLNGTFYGATTAGGTGKNCSTYYSSIAYGTGSCGTIFSLSPSGQERVIYSFKGAYSKGATDGAWPNGGLVAVNGNLYGTTVMGGVPNCGGGGGCGTVFEISPSGSEKIIYRFQGGNDGSNPQSGLAYANGQFYGTTYNGGSNPKCQAGCGTVFTVSPTGQESVVYRFAGGDDGSYPLAGLTIVGNTLYGTTAGGGSKTLCKTNSGCGTIWSIAL